MTLAVIPTIHVPRFICVKQRLSMLPPQAQKGIAPFYRTDEKRLGTRIRKKCEEIGAGGSEGVDARGGDAL
jgi:hypothetical protein